MRKSGFRYETKSGLSTAQEEAVFCLDGPILVSAGAGSGKTRTLTAKIAYLVEELGYDPSRILAITFTNKAANEMKRRLEAITSLSDQDFSWIRTFHSACFRILNQECHRLGYKPPLSVYGESQQKTIMKKVLQVLNVDSKYLSPVHSLISLAKNSGNPKGFLESYRKIPQIINIYTRYNEILKTNNAVDFDDILLLVRDLLKQDPSLREFYQNKFDYIMVDEFQDSNGLQNEIMELLIKNGNLMVVGDDYQSIYQFRGSNLFYFISFPDKFKKGLIFKLEENFRSTHSIVGAAQALIANNKIQIEKRCFSRRPGPPIKVMECLDEMQEARIIAHKCYEYGKRGVDFSEMAVLYRTRFCSLAFEEALREMRIPYKIVGARGFFEAREIQDINAYLISASNPKDDIAFERILNAPKKGIGAATIKKIETYKEPGQSLQEATWRSLQAHLLPKKTVKELMNLRNILNEAASMPPKKAIELVIAKTNYLDYLKSYCRDGEDFSNRHSNIEQLSYMASQCETLQEFIEKATLIREEQDQDQEEAGNRSSLKLMTIHGAKGLEFRVVFVAGLEEGLIPHWRSTIGEDYGENSQGLEEERRLLYVAMTRAAEELYLSWAFKRQAKINNPSRFLKEIPKEFVKIHKYTMTYKEGDDYEYDHP